MQERKQRSGVQLAYPFEEKRLAKWNPPYIVQPKLDGVRCRAVWNGHSFVLVSSTEEIITSVPHLNHALRNFLSDGSRPTLPELDGELYTHGWSFEQVYSVTARTVNLHDQHEQVQFHLFDYISDQSQLERTLTLRNLDMGFAKQPFVKIVPSLLANDLDELMRIYRTFLADAYEGIIVRHVDAPYQRKRVTTMMKFKPKKSDIYQIVGVVEEHDKHGRPKNSLGALVCRGDDETLFNVGSGFTTEQRQLLWEARSALPGKFVLVEYQHLTPGRGVPRFPIFCKLINDAKELTND